MSSQLPSVAKSVASSSTEPLVLVASVAYSAAVSNGMGHGRGCELGGRGERVAEIYDVSVVAEGGFMNIGEPLRIIEVEPLWIPLPNVTPAPTEQPAWEPELEPEPAIPEP
jgi:hypothetical protein